MVLPDLERTSRICHIDLDLRRILRWSLCKWHLAVEVVVAVEAVEGLEEIEVAGAVEGIVEIAVAGAVEGLGDIVAVERIVVAMLVAVETVVVEGLVEKGVAA